MLTPDGIWDSPRELHLGGDDGQSGPLLELQRSVTCGSVRDFVRETSRVHALTWEQSDLLEMF